MNHSASKLSIIASYADCESVPIVEHAAADTSTVILEKKFAPVTVLVPAYNEESTLAKTLSSLERQSTPAEKVVVVDDFSTDRTGDIARSYNVAVLRPPKNTGSKAGAQNYALPFVNSKYTIAIDADTSLDDNAIQKMVEFMEANPDTAAACSFVLPKNIETLWERGRFVEYIYIFPFYKRVQEWYGKPLICSGCFSIYRTSELKAAGGWSTRTMAEDMDLTWTLYENGKIVRYNHETYCYPIEPESFEMMCKQLKRWSHGWLQNVRLHGRKLMKIPVIREEIIAGLSDALFGGILVVVVTPLIAYLSGNPVYYGYGIGTDAALVAIPTLLKARKLKLVRKVLGSLPCFFVLRYVNTFFFYKALFSEFFLRRTLTKYEKGH